MNIVVMQREGLGNAILTTPLVQALVSLGHEVSVSIDHSRGSMIAFAGLSKVSVLFAPPLCKYDLALWAHPEWQHKIHKPLASETRYISVASSTGDYQDRFHKHEVEYLMDLACDLGFTGEVPPLYVKHDKDITSWFDHVAIGIGYFKGNTSAAKKHWSDENFRSLCCDLMSKGKHPFLVGSHHDFVAAKNWYNIKGILTTEGMCLDEVVNTIARCDSYIGNDTGLMHVAAALKKPCTVYFNGSSIVKNHPWGVPWTALEGKVSPKTMMEVHNELCRRNPYM